MIKKLIKLPFKIALLPLKVAKMILQAATDRSTESGAAASWTPPAGGSSAPQPPPEPPASSAGDIQVEPKEVLSRKEGGEGFVFVDVREAGELAATGKLDGPLHIPLRDLPRRFEELDRGTAIVLYCAVGMRSLDAAMLLRDKGFENAWSLRGGIPNRQAGGGELVEG